MSSRPPLSPGNPTDHEEGDKNTVRNNPNRNGESERSRRPAGRSSRFRLYPLSRPTHHERITAIKDFRRDGIMHNSLYQDCLDEKAAYIMPLGAEMQAFLLFADGPTERWVSSYVLTTTRGGS